MIRILIKAFILVCIILSIYFIVNPSACSNLINGRVVNTTSESFKQQEPTVEKNELLGPAGDKTDEQNTQKEPSAGDETAAQGNTAETTAADATGGYTQEEIDRAIAGRYVELEREYAQKGMDEKDMAKEISYTVMDDFELTPSEWEAFLQRATASNLFEEVRQQYAQQAAAQ